LNCSGSFESIYSYDSLYVFKYLGRHEESTEEPSEQTTALPVIILEDFSGDYPGLVRSGIKGIYMSGWGKDRDSVTRGGSIRLHVDWVTEKEQEFGSYVMYVRFDTDFEKGPLYSPSYGKIYRKVAEKFRGERYRFRIDKLPFEGIYPPDRWPVNKILREYIDVPVPKDIAPGKYRISIRLNQAPHVDNLRMKDLLRDDDFYDGPDLMTVTVE